MNTELATYIHIHNSNFDSWDSLENTMYFVCNGYDEQDSFQGRKFYDFESAWKYAGHLNQKFNTADIVQWDH